MTKSTSRTIIAAVIVMLLSGVTTALINPNFTPIHVVEQSATIAVLDVPKTVDGQQLSLNVAELLKGKLQQKSLSLDLSTASPREQGDAVRGLLSTSAGGTALLLAGEYVERAESGESGFGDGGFGSGGFESGPAMGGQEVNAQAFLHVSGRWIALYVGDDGQYQVRKIDDHMEGTWAGGTDMLCRAVRYILTDDDPEVPSASGVGWGAELKIAKLDGRVNSARPVWLDNRRPPYLFLACDQGDRLFRFDADRQQFEDLTSIRNLQSKSIAAVWGELNGNDRLDLASWDGESLTLHFQTADGAFQPSLLMPPGLLKQPCLGLAVVDGGEAARVALVVSTPTTPKLLLIGENLSATIKTLAADESASAELGSAGPCLVADFDGDLLPDLLQPFAGGSLLYKGDRETVFGAATLCPVSLGEGTSAAFLGDYDGDGRFDVFTVAEDRPRLWHNLGTGKFVETRGISGEVAYISQPCGVGGMTGDVNNDGRQDVLILYSDRQPHLFFNRGFRSFGHAHTLDLNERNLLPDSAEGQQAGCLAEFSGHGAQDMVLALANGEVWAMLRDDEYDDGLYAGASLATDCPFAGPINVTAEVDGRSLGAWNVSPGASTAFFGRMEAGPCTVKWQLPHAERQHREIIVEDRPAWFSIN